MVYISRRDLVLLLIGVGSQKSVAEGIGGVTRLQKFLFLLEREQKLQPTGDGFEFTPYKAGPYSARLYDDLEFLENLGLIDSEVAAEATDEEAAEVDMLTFEELVEDGADLSNKTPSDGLGAADAYEERRFRLTESGLARVKQLLDSPEYAPVADGIKNVKSKYGRYSLKDLLRYVYTKYPEMTTESEIRDQVLQRRR